MRDSSITIISDPVFDQAMTLRQSFHVLSKFLEQFNVRGPQETDLLASWLELQQDGGTEDPAQLDDFLECARAVLGHGTQQFAQGERLRRRPTPALAASRNVRISVHRPRSRSRATRLALSREI